jgi:type IX secretion system PorP/SprF family membrane protein
MFKRITLFLSLIFVLQSGFAQDISFSQRFVSSPYLNPALTGIFNGTVRIGAQYRDQWNSPLDASFQTYAASGDLKYNLNLFKQTSDDILGIGIQFVNDRVEGIDFNTSLIGLSAAFHKSLNPRKQHFLGFGMQLGVIQKNVNYEQLIFADQYNNVDDYSFPTAEPVPTNNFAIADLSLGILYLISPSKSFSLRAGLAFHHISTPNLSFFRFNEDYDKNDILPKITFHTTASFKTGAFTHLMPRFIIHTQGPFVDMELGSNIKFTTFNRDFLTFHLGLSTHIVKDLGTIGMASVVPFVGFQLNNVLVGVSYDVGINTLLHNQRNFSTLEFSVSYLGEYDNQPVFCPKF